MKPYWRDEKHGLEIHLGDCLEVMPKLEQEFDLCLTDPPYGVGYTGGTKAHEKLHGDSDGEVAFCALPLIYIATLPCAATYVWNSDTAWAELIPALQRTGFVRRATIIWDKVLAQYGALGAQYKQQHEYCFYLHKRGMHLLGMAQPMRLRSGEYSGNLLTTYTRHRSP